MIVDDPLSVRLPFRPAWRVREEADGGSVFEPVSGKVSRVGEDELPAWRQRAAVDDTVVYYATRMWTGAPLLSGCASSPNRVYLEVTQRCNLSCPFCYRSAGPAAAEELDTEEWLALISSLARIGVHELRFTGGEPTSRPDILELIDAALSAGFFVTLGSNGVLTRDMVNALAARDVGRFLISLDGMPPVHDRLRGAGTFERTIDTIRRLLAAGKKVRVNLVICRENLAHLRDFVQFCCSEGVENISLIVPRAFGRAGSSTFTEVAPDAADMERVARVIGPISQETGVRLEFQYNRYHSPAKVSDDPVIHKILSCQAGTEAAFISPEGVVYACGCAAEWLSDPVRQAAVAAGSGRHATALRIWQLWQDAAVWRPFRDLGTSKAAGCLACTHYGRGCFGSCPIHALAAGGRWDAPDPMCALSGNERNEGTMEAP